MVLNVHVEFVVHRLFKKNGVVLLYLSVCPLSTMKASSSYTLKQTCCLPCPPSCFNSLLIQSRTCYRLQKELLEWQVIPPAGFKHKPDNFQSILVIVLCTWSSWTLYAIETFQLE